MALPGWVEGLALWRGYEHELQTLLIYGIGIAVYTALVFTFYHRIAQRAGGVPRHPPTWWGRTLHVLENIFLFPLISFCYFAVLALSLFLLAKSQATSQILLMSMSVVVGVRFTAHISEAMSDDLAKLIPLSLLAVVVVDPGYLSLALTFERIGEAIAAVDVLARYFLLFILLEAVLRGVRMASPTMAMLWRRVDRHRRLSKKAMLKEVEAPHLHGFHGAPKIETGSKKTPAFLELGEHSYARPGAGQGVGPAFAVERAAPAAHAPAVKAPAARQGPGGSGGRVTRL